MAEPKYTRQTVTATTTWLPGKLFSLRTTRDPAFTFQAGQFARLGLPAAGDPGGEPKIWRAYSMVTGPARPELEFYSVVVPGGEFTPLLAGLREGDPLYIDKTAFGFLTLDRFAPGQDLWLLASGTGLSAYLSLLDDPRTWESYRHVVLVHGVRTADELAYRDQIESWPDLPAYAQYFRDAPRKLIYLPIASRETLPGAPQARLTTLLEDGRLERLAGIGLDASRSRVMLCGNPDMVKDARKLLAERGFAPGRRGVPGNLAVENYW